MVVGGLVTTESSLDRFALLLSDEDIDLVSSMLSSAVILSDTARIAFARSEYSLDDR